MSYKNKYIVVKFRNYTFSINPTMSNLVCELVS